MFRMITISLLGVAAMAAGVGSYALFSAANENDESSIPDTARFAMDSYDSGTRPETAVHIADLIVTGRVLKVAKPRWTTPDGKAPMQVFGGDVPPKPEFVYRVATVQVNQSIMGDSPRVVLVSLMGTGDDVGSQGAGWKQGDDVLLYLYQAVPGWRLKDAEYGFMDGYSLVGGIVQSRGLTFVFDDGDVPMNDLIARIRGEQALKAAGTSSERAAGR